MILTFEFVVPTILWISKINKIEAALVVPQKSANEEIQDQKYLYLWPEYIKWIA